MPIHKLPACELFDELNRCYDVYLSDNNIAPTTEFFVLKLMEELGEFSRSILALKDMHPKRSVETVNERLGEEAADFLCQAIILVARCNANVWPTIQKKWLGRLRLNNTD